MENNSDKHSLQKKLKNSLRDVEILKTRVCETLDYEGDIQAKLRRKLQESDKFINNLKS